MITAYRDPNRTRRRQLVNTLIHQPRRPGREVIALGRTLERRTSDVLAVLDRPHTSNGPTEASNGRLEHLCGSALGLRNSPTTSADR